jgi:2-polyprenyl-6-hydroxyphenyl methylase / 3-demethylubiquinone-9 3-methyltransferase
MWRRLPCRGIAKDGFTVTGIDPATRSIEAARQHAAENSLSIDYRIGKGEALPFPDSSFDMIACCDVLEHVDDPYAVIREVARTLKGGGVFCYDTINRTVWSKIVLKIWQDWRITRLCQPNVHVWEMFIEPGELDTMMRSCHLINQDSRS